MYFYFFVTIQKCIDYNFISYQNYQESHQRLKTSDFPSHFSVPKINKIVFVVQTYEKTNIARTLTSFLFTMVGELGTVRLLCIHGKCLENASIFDVWCLAR